MNWFLAVCLTVLTTAASRCAGGSAASFSGNSFCVHSAPTQVYSVTGRLVTRDQLQTPSTKVISERANQRVINYNRCCSALGLRAAMSVADISILQLILNSGQYETTTRVDGSFVFSGISAGSVVGISPMRDRHAAVGA